MPTDPQSIAVYVVVLLAVALLARAVFGKRAKAAGGGCDAGCGCSHSAAARREPAKELKEAWRKELGSR